MEPCCLRYRSASLGIPMHARFVHLQLPRNPVLRVLLGIAGVALLGVFALAGAALALIGLAALGLRMLWQRVGGASTSARASRPSDPDVIEGDFQVVERPRAELRAPRD